MRPDMLRHPLLASLLGYAILVICLIAADAGAAGPEGGYCIVLASAPGTGLDWGSDDIKRLDDHSLFVTTVTVQGKQWERLNVGYYTSREEAAAKLEQLQATYSGAWIRKSTAGEQKRMLASTTNTTTAPAITARDDNLTDDQLEELLQRAKDAIRKKNYAEAVRLLTAITEADENAYSPEALELLGLTRQRRGQNAHAVAAYRKYLEKYPTSDDAKRVKQRLSGLLTASRAPRDKITMKTEFREDGPDIRGGFSQYYLRNRVKSDDVGELTTLSQLVSLLDLTTTVRFADYSHRFQFTSDHVYDFLDNENDSEFRFIEAYYDLGRTKTGSSGRIGRQPLRIGGLLRRFDGLSGGYQITPDMRLNLYAGVPVDITNKSSINRHKTFYGLSFETGTFLEHWNMNLFHFDQTNDGLDDRTSTGAEIRYNDSTKSIFGMIDYDIFYKEVNIVQLNANFLFDRGITGYINAFIRKAPLLATENALIGRQEESLDELKQSLNIEQIYQLARDRTADSETMTLGASKTLNETFQATADITLSKVGDTIASGGVPATPGTGTDYYLNTQLVGNNLFRDRDTVVVGMRYYDTMYADVLSLIGNTRFYLNRNWRINPRLQYDIRNNSNGSNQDKIRALLRTDYRCLKLALFELEVGYDDINADGNGTVTDNNSLFVTMGYRVNF